MFQKILIANDGSEGAQSALRVAIDLAKRYGAELHSISVEEGIPEYARNIDQVMELKKAIKNYLARINQEAREMAEKEGVELQANIFEGNKVETIINYAKAGGFDLLIVGFMGHSKVFGRIWGSTSKNIAKLSPCAVVIVK